MKATKRIFSVFLTCVLAFTMAFAMGLTASAADTTYTITITKPEGDIDRTYEAYQIFKGNLSNNTLSDIEWGTGINGADFLTELQTNTSFTSFKSCTDAKTVAEKLATFKADSNEGADSDEVVAFAKLAGKFLTKIKATSSAGKITDLAAGYYLLKDVTDVTHDAQSLNILEVVKNVTVNPKADHPTVDKKIGTDISKGVAANEATIGDKVPFVIASNVPKMQGYTKYFFVLNDSMSAGLTYNKDVAIKIGTTTLATDAYVVTYDDKANTMKIVIKDFFNQYKNRAGEDIVVTYSATLNENANLTQDGNTNTVKLTYSNNPNVDYKGDNEPEGTDPVGETPEHVTVTYSTQLQLTKVDGANKEVMKGVEFQITGTSIKTAVSEGHYFKQDTAGEYYQLKDGTFTKTAPTAETESKYVSDLKYADVTGTAEETNMQKVTASGTTDANGLITFKGLGAGTYYITELKTLGGYNLLTAPITVKIDAKIDATSGTTSCTWTATVNNKAATFADDMVKLTVENNKGSVLPITGGIGTTIFYVIGGLLVCGAVVMAITKKKLSVEDKADQN